MTDVDSLICRNDQELAVDVNRQLGGQVEAPWGEES